MNARDTIMGVIIFMLIAMLGGALMMGCVSASLSKHQARQLMECGKQAEQLHQCLHWFADKDCQPLADPDEGFVCIKKSAETSE